MSRTSKPGRAPQKGGTHESLPEYPEQITIDSIHKEAPMKFTKKPTPSDAYIKELEENEPREDGPIALALTTNLLEKLLLDYLAMQDEHEDSDVQLKTIPLTYRRLKDIIVWYEETQTPKTVQLRLDEIEKLSRPIDIKQEAISKVFEEGIESPEEYEENAKISNRVSNTSRHGTAYDDCWICGKEFHPYSTLLIEIRVATEGKEVPGGVLNKMCVPCAQAKEVPGVNDDNLDAIFDWRNNT